MAVTSFFYVKGEPVERGLDAEALRAAARGDRGEGVLWLDLADPTDEEVFLLDEVFGFHPLAVEDCRERSESPKIDDYGEYLFCVFLGPDLRSPEASEIETVELDAFLGPRYVVTFHRGEIRGLAATASLVESSPAQALGRGADMLLHRLVDGLTDGYFTILKRIEGMSERVEDELMAGRGVETAFNEIIGVRKSVLNLRRYLGPQQATLSLLSRHPYDVVRPRTRLYFRDVYDHLRQAGDEIDRCGALVSGVMELYDSVTARRANEIMKVLTIIATIMMPLTLVTGIYGMNVELFVGESSPYAYPALLAVMVAIALGMILFFRRKGWF